jgi:hypothetical protein
MKNENEWIKPREYSFTNAAGQVFHEIAFSRQDVNTFAKMHKAISCRPIEFDPPITRGGST